MTTTLFPKNINADAFDLSKYDKQTYFARLTSEWREPSQTFIDRARERNAEAEIPEAVWYLEWENLSRPVPFNRNKEIAPPTPGQALRNSMWKVHIDAFNKAGVPIRTAADVPDRDGMIFWVEEGGVKFGRNRQTNEDIIANNVVLPQRIATPEEIAALETSQAPGGTGQAEVTEDAIQAIRDSITSYLSTGPCTRDELLEAIESGLNGDKSADLSKAIVATLTDMDKAKEIVFDYVEGTVALKE